MMDRPTIRDCMTRDLVTLSSDMEINHAMTILVERRISGAPVLGPEGELVGVLSKKDCLRAALNASYYNQWGDRVVDYMSHEIATLNADTDIIAAAEAFLASPYRRFPVLSEGKLVGQVSRADILTALSKQWK